MLVRECEYFIKVTNDSSTGPRFGIFADGYEVAGLSARLIGVPFPSSRLFREESFDGVRWISCLSSTNPEHRYSTHPWKLERLDSVQLDSPLGGTLSTKRALLSLALRIQRKLRDGEGVLVHCDMGIERTGAVLGTVLALRTSQKGHVLTLDRRRTLQGVCKSGLSRRGHVLTLDRRRNLRGGCKSWPQGGVQPDAPDCAE